MHSFLSVRSSQVDMRKPEVRIHFKRPSLLFHYLIVIASVVESSSQVRADDKRKRIKPSGQLQFRDTLIAPPHCRQVLGIPVVRRRVSRIPLDGLPEFSLGAVPLPVMKHGMSHRCMSFGELLTNL